MRGGRALDVLIVSLGSTGGLRAADEELEASLQRAGASVATARADAPRPRRTLMLTDLEWARAARAAAAAAIAPNGAGARAVIYSSTTAALLWPRAGAIRFDAPAAGNRPGRHGLWQRPLERRRLAETPLLLPWSAGGLAESAPPRAEERTLVLPVPVSPSGAPGESRDIAAITYAANPRKKGLDRVLSAWRQSRARHPREEEQLILTGVTEEELERSGFDLSRHEGIRVAGVLGAADYRALLRRARVFIAAPRREDYGIAQLEALADGCQLVTTPSPGPYAALPIARALDPRLVSEDLAGALAVALDTPLPDYASRARGALEPFSREAADSLVADRLLPRLLG
jgi:hypothetical protein